MTKISLLLASAISGFLVFGCAADVDTDDQLDEEMGTADQAVSVAEASWVTDVTPPAGVNYTDIAIGRPATGDIMYLSRSDNRVEKRTGSSWTVTGYLPFNYQRLEWISNTNWGLIASNDAERKIYALAQGTGRRLLGEYPAGVDSVNGLAAFLAPGSGNRDLKLVVTYSRAGSRYKHAGDVRQSSPGRIYWEGREGSTGRYSSGLTATELSVTYPYVGLYTVHSYYDNYFIWYSYGDNFLYADTEKASGWRWDERTYVHPDGFLDRFNPSGITRYGSYFYGIDHWSYGSLSGWAITRLPTNRIYYD